MPSIYLSPSLQPWNQTVLGVSEQYLMGLVADAVEPLLRINGISYRRNRVGMTLSQAIADSNAYRPDLHVSIHSNADMGTATGSRHYYYPTSTNGKRFADYLVSTFKQIYYNPNNVKTVSDSTLAELRSVNAPSVISEVAFHDNMTDAIWIRDNIQNIAAAIVRAICLYFGITYRGPCTQGTTPGSSLVYSRPIYAMVCTAGGALNIRSSPNGPILFTLPNTSQVLVTGSRREGFIPIRSNFNNGWASEQFLCLCNEINVAPPPPPPPSTGIVVTSGSNLNLRISPSTTASILASIPNGSTVTIIGGPTNGFYQVTHSGRTGWASSQFIRPSTAVTTGIVSTMGGNLNLRSAPSTSASILRTIPNGSTVTILGTSGDFYNIIFQGTNGFAVQSLIR